MDVDRLPETSPKEHDVFMGDDNDANAQENDQKQQNRIHPMLLKELTLTSSPLPPTSSSKPTAVDVLNHLLLTKVVSEHDIRSSIDALTNALTKRRQEHHESQEKTVGCKSKASNEASRTETGHPITNDVNEIQGNIEKTTTTENNNVRRRHIAIQFYYDGGEYSGLAQNVGLDADNSVERQLFDALLKANLIESRQSCGYSRCGRTDRGVSSCGQVVALHVKSSFAPQTSYDEHGFSMVQDDDLPSNEYDSLSVWTVPRSNVKDRKVRGTKRSHQQSLSSDSSETNSVAQHQYQQQHQSIRRQHKPSMKEYPYTKILNNLLPSNIRVLGWTPVTADFSARFSATTRTYRYFFCRRQLNLNRMRQGLKLLEGKHDFRNLCKMDVEHVSNFVRVIHKADVVTTLDEVDGMDIDQSDPMQLHHDNQHQICYFQIVGQAFLWHQIRCIVEVLFYIGRELEPPSVITDLLDVDKNPRKPSYPYADEKPLVLHHCGFMNLQFGYSVSNIWTVMCQLEHQWEELSLAAARIRNCINTLYDVSIKKEDLISFCESNKKKLGCYSTSSLRSIVSDLTADGDDGTSTVQWKFALECILRHFNTVPDPQGLNSSVHIPLLQRSKGTSYEEKVVALQGNSKRKMKYEENIVQKKQPEEVDKEFYERKQKQGGQGL